MPFFKRAKYDEPPRNNALVPFAVLFIVFMLLTMNVFTHFPLFIESLFINVQHPLLYKFPQYSELLPEVVKGDYVDYQKIAKTHLLKEAVADLARTSPDDLEDENQRFCFWINGYNMLVLRAIMERYPLERLDEKRLTRSFSADKYFVGGKAYSIEEIKRTQLLPRLSMKPTALFLICNGSLGGPPLLDHTITPKTFDLDAEAAAHKFILKKGNADYDALHKTFVLSPMFKWNESIFVQYGGAAEFANKYRPKNTQLDLASRDVLFKSFARNFNWYLNDTALQHTAEQKDDKASESTAK